MKSLSTLEKPLKIVLTIYILITSAGFFLGLAFIRTTSDFKPSTVIEHYKGTTENIESTTDIKFEKSVKDLLLTTHNHILGLSSVFFITSTLFWFTTFWNKSFKLFLMIEPFISLFLTFGGIWIVRFLFEPFVFIVIMSGFLMFIAYGLMIAGILRELWFVKPNKTESSL